MPEREEKGITVGSFEVILISMSQLTQGVNPPRPAFPHGGLLKVGGEVDQASIFRKLGGKGGTKNSSG